jgi:hypothetical protein
VKPKKGKPLYTGILAKRCAPAIPRGSTFSQPTAEEVRSATDARLAHMAKGIILLFEHYKIPKSDEPFGRFAQLVARLASDHVPYFQEPNTRRRGAPVDRLGYLRLELELAAEKRPTDRGDFPALKRLASAKPNRNSVARGKDEEGLRKQLQRARKDRFVRGLTSMARRVPHLRAELEELAGAMGHI